MLRVCQQQIAGSRGEKNLLQIIKVNRNWLTGTSVAMEKNMKAAGTVSVKIEIVWKMSP